MTTTVTSLVNFEFGEISPIARSRHDLKMGNDGLEKCVNFIVEPHGPIRFRTGTRFVSHTRRDRKAVFIPFQFNDQQSYLIEATDLKFRFYKDNGIIVESAKTITGITSASQGVVTSAAHGYSNGDEVILKAIVGMVPLNNRSFVVANVTTNTFKIQDNQGNYINTSGYAVYTSGGTAEKVYEVTTPYAEADLETLQYAQNADTMYIAHQNYAPRKLARTGHTSWTLSTYVRTADPFTGPNWPRAVTFTSDARLMFASTPNKPETFWGSRSPSTGGARYDDFTIPGTPTDSDAIIFTLAPVHGQVDAIQWLSNTDKFIVMGTFGTVRRVYGASEQEPVTPTAITAKSVNTFGCALTLPVTIGTTVFYIERGSQRIRSFEYDYKIDGYLSKNRNLIADHLTEPGVKQMVFQSGSPNTLWVVRNDGKLLGLTYEEAENKAGWHQHKVSSGNVKWAAIMPRATEYEQLWVIIEKAVGGVTYRTVEYFEDQVLLPQVEDSFISGDTKEGTRDKYNSYLYELQRQQVFLDQSLTYDGSAYGTAAGASLTFSATTGSGVTVTASAAVFDSSMVGRSIQKKYASDGTGGGIATITAYTDSTHVTVTVESNLDNVTSIPGGSWYLSATTATGLWHLEGQTVGVVGDGAVYPDEVVTNGAITIDSPAFIIHAGLKYTGFAKTLNLGYGGVNGSAQAKRRGISEVGLRFLHTTGTSVGTTLWNLEKVVFRNMNDVTNRPTPLYTGYKKVPLINSSWADEKHLCIYQDVPLPCIITGIEIKGETSND